MTRRTNAFDKNAKFIFSVLYTTVNNISNIIIIIKISYCALKLVKSKLIFDLRHFNATNS